MPISYRVARLQIRNFRGIPELDLEFKRGTPTYLIGANNSGKSTVLNAISCAFRQGPFLKAEFGDFDFFRKKDDEPADEFTTTVYFEAEDERTLPAVQDFSSPVPVHGVRTRGQREVDGSANVSTFLVKQDGKAIAISPRLPIKNEALKQAYKDHEAVGFTKRNARPQDIQSELPELWHLRPDNLHASLYLWKSGPLARLAKLLSQRFFEEEWSFKFKGRDFQMPDRLRLAHEFFKTAVVEFPFWKQDLKPKLDNALSSYLGRQAGVELRPTIQQIEEWLAQQLAVSVAADADGAVTPLASMGDGWQSMVRLAALDVLRQIPDQVRERVILLFEEPEAYLHPHLRRKLRDVLADLSSQGWTVVCSTHAPEFISFEHEQQVVRLSRSGDTVSSGAWLTSGTSAEIKLQEKLDEHGTHEMLFANCVVLCEGKEDQHAIRRFLERTSLDLDGKSVSTLGVGGVANLPDYARIAKTLGIRWCALLDEDRIPGQPRNAKTAQVRARLDGLQTVEDAIFEWPQDLEACLKQTDGKALPEWQERTLGGLSLTELKAGFADYCQTGEAVQNWVDQNSA